MPQCRICDKKFSTLDALEQHHRTVHKNVKFMGPKKPRPKYMTTLLVIAIIAVSAVVGVLIYEQQAALSKGPANLNQPISADFYGNITDVSAATLDAVGYQATTSNFTAVQGTPLNTTKPVVLYIGGEYCPFCGVERWGMVIALSHFGNFTGLRYMQTPPSEGSIDTLTFYGSNYTSNYITFIPIEHWDRERGNLQPIPPQYLTLFEQYDPNGSIPFIDINNEFVTVGSQISPAVISGLNWTQIYTQLNNPNSPVAKQIDSAANVMINAICAATGGVPKSVCEQPFALSGAQPTGSALPSSISHTITSPQVFKEVSDRWID
jgi:hypothetical protein